MKFIHGHAFARRCRWVLDAKGWHENLSGVEPFIFVKTDFVAEFFSKRVPTRPFKLVTHNSDYPIDATRFRDHPMLVKWYAQNVALQHPKLVPVPIGIGNPEWPHGDQLAIAAAAAARPPKSGGPYANFNVATNASERRRCLARAGAELSPPNLPFGEYLRQLSTHRLALCPSGNGLDTHRIWEALYVGTHPVTTRAPWSQGLARQFPILLVDDWSEVTSLRPQTDRPQACDLLDFDAYFERVLLAD